MQMLYEHDIVPQSVEELIHTYWRELRDDADPDVRAFAERLVRGTLDHQDEIDRLIATKTEHWRLERMATVDRNILRLAVYEFLYEPETPRVVVINEALEIARRYSTYEATQFINGLLDAIRRTLEAEKDL